MSKEKPNQNFVLAVYENEAAAESGITALRAWDQASQEIMLGDIGTIRKENGKIKTNMGRKTGGGAKIGAVLGVAGALLGPVGLIGGLLAGALVGGAAGSVFTKRLKLTDDEIADLNKSLDEGKVVVVVACDEYEMAGVADNMRESGGQVFTLNVPQETLDEAAQQADQAAPEDPAA